MNGIMAFLEGTKALEKWCKVVTADYENVNIVNMSTSWRNGLGFCAIIHHFRPDLIDFESLDEDDILGNNILAFSVGEQHLSIPALLDPQDMVECELLDRLSILTYLSQFYQAFHGATAPNSGKAKRTGSSRSSSATASPVKSLVASKMPMVGRRNEPCKMCGKVVFILERLNVGGKLLHRTCFKCARCGTQLNIVNYYETEKGDYCCDVCPDEETNQEKVVEANKRMVSEHLDSGLENSSSESEDEDNNNSNVYDDPKRHPSGSKTEKDKESLDNQVGLITKNLDENLNVTPKPMASSLPNETDTCQEESSNQIGEGKTEGGSDEDCSNNEKHLKKEGEVDDNGDNVVRVEEPTELDNEVVLSNKPIQSNEETLNSEGHDFLTKPVEVNDDSCRDSDDVIRATSNANESENVPLPHLTNEEDNVPLDVDETDRMTKIDEEDKPGDEKEDKPSEEDSTEVATEEIQDDKPQQDPEPAVRVDAQPPEIRVETEEQEQSDKLDNNKETEDSEKLYPGDMNPFGDEDESEPSPVPPKEPEKESKPVDTSTNPFGSDFEDSGEEEKADNLEVNVPKPEVTAAQGPLANTEPPPKPPRVNASLNPFGSDFEDDEDDDEKHITNRSSRSGSFRSPSPTPSSASSMRSRKKRMAPKPPGASSTPIASPRTSVARGGPVPSPRGLVQRSASPTLSMASTVSFYNKTRPAPPPPRPPPPKDLPKQRKDQDNQKRRSQMIETGSISSECSSVTQTSGAPSIILTPLSPDKAIEGQWKKKKGPAPPRPIPQKRQVKKIPRKAVNTELHDIEIKQQELERQGVKLEKTIRELCERNDRERCEQGLDITDRDSLGPEVEDLIIQLFDLVNEKNDLFRRQTELIYMKRDHRLEEEHADIEHQIRLLMVDASKCEEDKAREDKLIARLMEIVSQRNEIVDCMEMDRLRELEEDESIEIHMGEYAAIKPTVDDNIKKKMKKKKEKKSKKKDKNFDADKDVDTKEFPNHQSPKASPKKMGIEKDKAKRLKRKILNTLSVSTSSLRKS